jgi:hypothetical protein
MKKASLLAAAGLCVTVVGTAFAGDTIWGIDNSRNVLGTFDSANPGVFTDVGPTGIGTGFTNSLEFDGSGGLYASDGTQLFKVNTSTGAATLVGSHGNLGGESITDFAWDGSQMWAIGTICGASSSLWTINLATGAATKKCTSDIAGSCDVGLTVGADGVVYGQELVFNIIYKIDPNTCVTSTVINLPYDANFGQGLTASSTTNYHVAFNSTAFLGELYSFDGAGNYNLLGALQPLQIAAADVEGGPSDCLTLTVTPLVAGTSATWNVSGATAGEQVAVVYGFQPGTTGVNGFAGYCATFGIKGVNQNKLICRKNADGAGNVSCRKSIPAGVRGQRVLSQAAERNTCPAECVSNLDDQVVQ